jgi:ribosomal protein RSM22 (predicted rRNA methylase)
MLLAADLARAIDEHAIGMPASELRRATAELTNTYRAGWNSSRRLDKACRVAYLLTRLPATFAVLSRVLSEAKVRAPDLRIESMLDLGAGPGTAMWAASETFAHLTRVSLVEDRPEWIAVGKELARKSLKEALRKSEWKQATVVADGALPGGSFDLVTMSYVLNELVEDVRSRVIEAAWRHCSEILVVTEPGTPTGFEIIRQVRRQLIGDGAHIVAPCPHPFDCPMTGGSWCHFAERLPRTSEHRLAKSAELSYEDEKYSYVVFARRAAALPEARIVRHPRKHSGHVELEICMAEGLKRTTVSRREGERYKRARKAEWGDTF